MLLKCPDSSDKVKSENKVFLWEHTGQSGIWYEKMAIIQYIPRSKKKKKR